MKKLAGLPVKAAFAFWDKRIAPVFDTARSIMVVEAEWGRIINESLLTFANDQAAQKACDLAEIGVNELICGAVSQSQQALITAHGIRVIPFISGDLREVMQAWLSGRLDRGMYAMPGCCRRGKKWLDHSTGGKSEVHTMNGRGRGMGAGGGRGQGQGRLGREGGQLAAGPGGYCVCPQCGHRETHERGVPCMQMKCPKCGITMARQ